MNASGHNQTLYCKETDKIEKMYSDQAVFTYSLMVFSIFIYGLVLVMIP